MIDLKRVQEAHDRLCQALEIMGKADTADAASAWRVLGHLDILVPTAHDALCEALDHDAAEAFAAALSDLGAVQDQLPFEA